MVDERAYARADYKGDDGKTYLPAREFKLQSDFAYTHKLYCPTFVEAYVILGCLLGHGMVQSIVFVDFFELTAVTF